MRTWAYPAVIAAHGADDFSVVFPDIPEVVTGGGSLAEARMNAADALEEAILGRMAHHETLPVPRDAGEGEELVILDPVTASRAALVTAMAEKRISKVALAKLLGKSEGTVRRLVDGSTSVKIDTVLQALGAIGSRAGLAVVTSP